MKSFRRTAVMPYSREQMFAIVRDVNRYAEFLPWCRSAAVVSEQGEELVARMDLSRGPLTRRFTTRNIVHDPEWITMELIEGPLEKLSGRWAFTATSEKSCRVTVTLDIEFTSPIAARLFGIMFNPAADKLVQAFREQADRIYGRSSASMLRGEQSPRA